METPPPAKAHTAVVKPGEPKTCAPGLSVIIGIKLLKGALFLTLAVAAYTLSDNDLPYEFHRLMDWLRVHPGNQFFENLASNISHVSETKMLWAALGTLVYSLFSLVEGVGLIYRVTWASWLAIGESGFFIPIEVADLVEDYSWSVFLILILNLFIVWYLLRNRHRLFHHMHFHHKPTPPS
jgi:uncharacterized membrane protein (DUF2068 family)